MPAAKGCYPFTAIVGQEEMKKGLLLNAINPRLSGILIKGEKGTAKSTAVRSLAALLPEINVVQDCPFGCDPEDETTMCINCRERVAGKEHLPVESRKMKVVELPLSVTEDRVVGTIDLEKAIKTGEKHFEPGILACANRGILYIDEVNLLDDHIVDILLDSAAMGYNIVEREGVSFEHPANFILVGTMNPEEGELRPQLLDRFGLCVGITGITDPGLRVEVIKRRLRYEADPQAFAGKWEDEEEKIRRDIVGAKNILPDVAISDVFLFIIAKIAIEVGVDGHRADITMIKTAKTMAALNGRKEVNADDVLNSVNLALQHRMRRRPFQEPAVDRERLQDVINGLGLSTCSGCNH